MGALVEVLKKVLPWWCLTVAMTFGLCAAAYHPPKTYYWETVPSSATER
jgi:hypothetical protein